MLDVIKCKWTWNNMYQNVYNKAKNNEKNMTRAFYSGKEQLYLETDACNVGLGASLLQEGTAVPKEWNTWLQCAAANTICQQKHNKHGNLLQQHRKRSTKHTSWPRKLSSLPLYPWSQHYYKPQASGGYFQERCCKPITLTFKLRVLLEIHQSSIRILYNLGPQLLITDRLSRNNHETEMKKYPACGLSSM